MGDGAAVVAPPHDDTLLWDDPGRKWEVDIKDREAASLVLKVVRENTSWPAAKAREVVGLHEALGLEWPPRDGDAVEEGSPGSPRAG